MGVGQVTLSSPRAGLMGLHIDTFLKQAGDEQIMRFDLCCFFSPIRLFLASRHLQAKIPVVFGKIKCRFLCFAFLRLRGLVLYPGNVHFS